MDTDRRHVPRKRLTRLAYIRIGADNGGLVSDLSERGLGFQTIAAIEREGPLRFWFTLDAADRIQATGVLAWTDETRKVGGLRFTEISDEALTQIREWVGAGSGASEMPSPQRPPAREPVPFSPPPRKTKTSAIPVTSSPIPEPPIAVAPPTPVIPTPPRTEPLRVMATPQHWSAPILTAPPREVVSPEMVRGLTSVLTVVAIILTVVALVFGYHREIGRSLVRLGDRLTGESPIADVAPTPDATEVQQVAPPPVDTSAAAQPAVTSRQDSQPPVRSGSPQSTLPSTQQPAYVSPQQSPLPPAHQSIQATPPPTQRPAESSALQTTPSSQPSVPAGTRPAPPASTDGYRNLSANPPASGDTGKIELDTASQFLNPVVGPPNYTEAAKWLWMAVEKGNPSAEVLLSDLFIRGVGVPQNCIQARVLLNAAVRHGSYEAVARLKALNRAGCS